MTTTKSHRTANFPLRFSSVFWTRNDVEHEENDAFVCFETNVIIKKDDTRGVPLMVAARRDESILRRGHASRIEGHVAAGGINSVSTIFEDADNTIEIDHAEVRVKSLVDKVSAHGVGLIVDWDLRSGPDEGCYTEVIKAQRYEFYFQCTQKTWLTFLYCNKAPGGEPPIGIIVSTGVHSTPNMAKVAHVRAVPRAPFSTLHNAFSRL
ncbi:uncharacterized protein MELLADRAFT_62549 [Melampsora larici-populina 98AG31]|uniref:Uncharacterized protein n=1 Tax=Melampsora larici-populina (strain 98AG31 / pathotype 3-4-7) TaxID=747676 RepID=F4RJB7_MELLP|nr:uncharacterized protein MELLADRAFT_62549 [Melampsora larici-populina 98AG31]EGG07285.1 hypothetical protein MELLADRAFT_62549 [Melampsora larici-populina 98AG31]